MPCGMHSFMCLCAQETSQVRIVLVIFLILFQICKQHVCFVLITCSLCYLQHLFAYLFHLLLCTVILGYFSGDVDQAVLASIFLLFFQTSSGLWRQTKLFYVFSNNVLPCFTCAFDAYVCHCMLDTVFVIFMFSVVPFLCQVFDDHCTKFLLSFLFFLVLHIFCLLHAVAHYHICLCTRVLRVDVCGVLEIKYLLPSSAVDIIPVVAISLL